MQLHYLSKGFVKVNLGKRRKPLKAGADLARMRRIEPRPAAGSAARPAGIPCAPMRGHPMKRTINFNAGPAALPLPALERARDELLDLAGSGMSVMEHSHRGKEYEAVHDEALALLRELLAVPASHEILFLQGGASTLFAQIPMNFLEKGKTAHYVTTGSWGEKAIGEAKLVAGLFGAQVTATSTGTGEGKETSYGRATRPGEVKVDPAAAYLHVTSNE